MGFQRQSNVPWKRGCESPGPHVSLARLRKRRDEYSQWSFSGKAWKQGCESPGPHVSLARLRKRRNEHPQWRVSGKATFLGSGVAKARARMSALRGLENAGSEF